jgi:cytochrome c oxidase cbb3-type subunit 4
MSLDDVRIAWTVASFLVFVAIVFWAYSRGARRGFDEAAQLPFADESRPGGQATKSAGSQ